MIENLFFAWKIVFLGTYIQVYAFKISKIKFGVWFWIDIKQRFQAKKPHIVRTLHFLKEDEIFQKWL